ncbi:site-specific integrase [Parabacteroides sp. FAFU027]|uniref:site-specific integrase n=1 Tax=Parabacteroides sp. FAFU027 TaxID=2922715 RepID=UPI001FAF86EF|nr:site-specific integrase [Parabacteroides sp. FAFU027]
MTKVKVRERVLKNGSEKSLYLDFYPPIRDPRTGKAHRKEYLKIYPLVNPKTEAEKELNKIKYFAAETERLTREREIINRQYSLYDRNNANRSFTDYYSQISTQKGQQVWKSALGHFKNFSGRDIKMGEINQDLIDGFRTYLQSTKQIKTTKNPQKLTSAAASAYFNKFIELLKMARKMKYITEDYSTENIKVLQNKRQFLNLDEIKKLVATDCNIEVLKRASLFSCMTGFRFGDIKKLRWGDIEYLNAEKPYITIRQSKTGSLVNIPLFKDAITLCGEKKENNDLIFGGLAKKHIDMPLKKWLNDAQIQKKITFHCFRHSFATLLIQNGFEIYAVQKLLGHKSVNTTQIYTSLNAEQFRAPLENIFK